MRAIVTYDEDDNVGDGDDGDARLRWQSGDVGDDVPHDDDDHHRHHDDYGNGVCDEHHH